MFAVLLAAFLGVVLLCVKPLGSYIAGVMQFDRDRHGPPNFALRAGGRIEGLFYRFCGIDCGEEMSWAQYAIAMLLFNVLGAVARLWLAASAVFPAAKPAKFRGGKPGLLLQHCGEFHHQHQLAGIFRRVDHGIFRADGGTHGAELPVRGHRDRRGHRFDSRFCAAYAQNHRQLLGRCHARDSLRAAAAVRRARVRSRESGRHPEFRRLSGRDDRRKDHLSESQESTWRAMPSRMRRQRRDRDGDHPDANAADGSGRLARGHQRAGHQRRRLFQREFRASVRESHRP